MGRINKVIELLEQGQPAYSTPAPELTYESGLEASQTWADLLLVEFEHFAFDIKGLTDFMRGLKDGGPTPSGHATPTVVASLPSNCRTRDEVIYNAWQTRHVLSPARTGSTTPTPATRRRSRHTWRRRGTRSTRSAATWAYRRACAAAAARESRRRYGASARRSTCRGPNRGR